MADDTETPPPFIHNDVQRENVSGLLHAWGLSDLTSKFKSHRIETRALHCLTEKDICELIPKIGRRAIFRSNLLEWRRQTKHRIPIVRTVKGLESKPEENIPIPHDIVKNEALDSDEELAETNSEHVHMNNNNGMSSDEMEINEEQHERPKPVPMPNQRRYSVVMSHKRDRSCHIDINEILLNSYEGQQIIAYYEVNGNFDYCHRRRLVTLLINEVIRKNRWLVQDDFAQITQDIVRLFPREDEATYYIARNGARNPKGCLYNKFLNLTRKLRQEGILQYRNNVHLIPERTSARHSGEIKCYRESS